MRVLIDTNVVLDFLQEREKVGWAVQRQKIETLSSEEKRRPYRFYFYSYDCHEPRHIHADRENRSAKFWLDLDVTLATNHGYNRRDMKNLKRIIIG